MNGVEVLSSVNPYFQERYVQKLNGWSIWDTSANTWLLDCFDHPHNWALRRDAMRYFEQLGGDPVRYVVKRYDLGRGTDASGDSEQGRDVVDAARKLYLRLSLEKALLMACPRPTYDAFCALGAALDQAANK